MNILLISYGDYRYDGRLRELVKAFRCIGKLQVFCTGEAGEEDIRIVGKAGYRSFISEVIAEAKKLKSVDVLVVDNRRACVPGVRLLKLLKPKVVIQDCRELYLSEETHGVVGKIGCFFEQRMLKKADIVIAANEERAEMMKELYQLRQKPVVYENLRRLTYANATEEECRARLGKYIHEDEYRIISTSGCSFARTSDVLVRNLDQVKAKVRVFLVGNSAEEDVRGIQSIMKEKHLNNVEIIGNLQQAELKYLISHSHIGIVNYHQKDKNNQFCASGKIYEYLYEGIPVVTTTNPPLKKMCDRYGIGYATDEYYDGINRVLEQYGEYQEQVYRFAEAHKVEDNNSALIQTLQEKINEALQQMETKGKS